MATATQQQTYWERAKDAGFDLGWLNQLQENIVTDEAAETSENLRG